MSVMISPSSPKIWVTAPFTIEHLTEISKMPSLLKTSKCAVFETEHQILQKVHVFLRLKKNNQSHN